MQPDPTPRRNFLRGLAAGLLGWLGLGARRAAVAAPPEPLLADPVPLVTGPGQSLTVSVYDRHGKLLGYLPPERAAAWQREHMP